MDFVHVEHVVENVRAVKKNIHHRAHNNASDVYSITTKQKIEK